MWWIQGSLSTEKKPETLRSAGPWQKENYFSLARKLKPAALFPSFVSDKCIYKK